MNVNNTTSSEGGSVLSSSFERLKRLIQPTSTNEPDVSESPSAPRLSIKKSHETYHDWGVRWSGNAGANHTALHPALQSCYTYNVNEQNSNQVIQEQNQQNINSQIESKKGQRDGEKIKMETKQRDHQRIAEDITGFQNKIDEIKSSDRTNIMARVNFIIGAVITVLLAAYLFVFYSSASFSAFFGNNDISGAGDAILDSHCFAEASANGLGQLLFILLMPIIFLGLGFLIHQFGESGKGMAKYIKITGLYIVTFIFDALLAFEISKKVFDNTNITDETYTVSMAFNSPDFWIVIFSGFVAYVIWGMVFDFTLQHFDNMNSHTKEISVLEDKIKNAKQRIDKLDTEISQLQLSINTIETDINRLNTQLQCRTVIDTNILKQALSEFFMGWVAYMHLAGKSQNEKEHASQTYNSFISQL